MIHYYPKAFLDIFGMKIPTEPVALVLVFCLLFIYCRFGFRQFDRKNVDPGEFAKLAGVMVLFSLILGRLWFFIPRWRGFETLGDIFNPNSPGLISVGMLVGAMFGVLVYVFAIRRSGSAGMGWLQVAMLADVLAPVGALCVFVYRLVGCSLYGICTKGIETAVPWGLLWVKEGIVRHPVPFYLSLSGLGIFLLLRLFFSYIKKQETFFGKRFDGEVALWFGLLYCFNRFWIEFLRTGKEMFGHFNSVQWVCIIIFFMLVVVAVVAYRALVHYGLDSFRDYRRFVRKRGTTILRAYLANLK